MSTVSNRALSEPIAWRLSDEHERSDASNPYRQFINKMADDVIRTSLESGQVVGRDPIGRLIHLQADSLKDGDWPVEDGAEVMTLIAHSSNEQAITQMNGELMNFHAEYVKTGSEEQAEELWDSMYHNIRETFVQMTIKDTLTELIRRGVNLWEFFRSLARCEGRPQAQWKDEFQEKALGRLTTSVQVPERIEA